MSDMPINPYEAVIADLEARKAQIELTIANLKAIAAQSGTPIGGPGGGNLGPSAFLGMSIPDAAKAHLSAVKQKKSTQEIIEALTDGGLPPSKYTTVYNILTRRQRQVGDIVNMKGDWALAEWYPNHRFKVPKEQPEKEDEKIEKEAATA
jgi:hypothetical protein